MSTSSLNLPNLPTIKLILLSSTAVLLTGLTSYALYFDYKRRNDPIFRKNLLKQNKKLQKSSQQASALDVRDKLAALSRALVMISGEELPVGAQAQEQYFMEQVALGEQLAARADNPEFLIAAATSFYKALRVYPNPEELLNIYQKTQPPAVFELVMMMLQLEGTMPRRTAPVDPRDISTSALLTEIEPESPIISTSVPVEVEEVIITSSTASSENSLNGSSPPASTGSFVHVDEIEVGEGLVEVETPVLVVVEETVDEEEKKEEDPVELAV